jgi:hypothetical protein
VKPIALRIGRKDREASVFLLIPEAPPRLKKKSGRPARVGSTRDGADSRRLSVPVLKACFRNSFSEGNRTKGLGPFPGSISTSLGPLAGCGIEGAHAIVRTMGERDREPTMSIEPWARQHCPFSMANRQAPGAAARLPPSFPCRVGVLIRHHGDRASAERVRRMKTESPKKRRAKRARARQRSRYDLRDRYRRRDLPAEHIAVAVIEDPYSQAGYADAEGNLSAAPEWVPPRRPMMTVVRALREDPVGRMFARHQIDTAQYQAARAFQQAADQSTIGSIKSVDLEKTKVSGGLSPEPLTDGRRRAMARLRVAEERLMRRHGSEGLGLTRAVLVERQSVEQTARLRGAESDREVWFWSRLFRRCLDSLASAFGFATSGYRPRRSNGHHAGEQDPADDPGRQADESDLIDSRLRSAR